MESRGRFVSKMAFLKKMFITTNEKKIANMSQVAKVSIETIGIEQYDYHAEMNEQNSGENWSDGADGGG